MLTRLVLSFIVLLFALPTFSAHQTQYTPVDQVKKTEKKVAQAATLSLYTRVVPNAECGSTENMFIYLESASVELAPGVPVWGGNPSNPQPLAWALVFSNWGSNSGTAYFILNGYVYSSFIPC